MADVSVLNVRLHQRNVGTLTLLPGDQSAFAFSDDYIATGGRPTLSLSFQDTLGELLTYARTTQTRVHPFFSNLLPEGSLREYLAERAGVHQDREFFLLWVLGQDLPGAVTVEPAHEADRLPGSALERGSEDSLLRDGVLRFSLAGVQLKFSALVNAAGGLTIPATGTDGSWIVKLPSHRFPAVPENELAMMRLAAQVGIEVPEVRLIPTEQIDGIPAGTGAADGLAYAIKRFDRRADGRKVHMEDFAQVFGVFPHDKYKEASYRNLAEVFQAEVGSAGVAAFVRRLVFCALIGNADMHLKNWSLIHHVDGTVAVAPAYDLLSTIPYLDDTNMALNLYKPGTKPMSGLSTEALRKLAGRARLSERIVLRAARETVERFRDAWRDGAQQPPAIDFVVRAINEHYPTVPLVRELS